MSIAFLAALAAAVPPVGSSAAQTPGLEPAAPASAAPNEAEFIARLTAAYAARGFVAAVTPLETMAPDPAATGTLWLDQALTDPPAIARQPVRPIDAVTMAAAGDKARVLPMAILEPVRRGADGRAQLPATPAARLYCDGRDRRDRGIVCYQDLDGDGRMETRRIGYAAIDRNAATLTHAGPAETIAPVAYARASAEAWPRYELIYQSCRRAGRIFYGTRLGVPGDGDIKSLGCNDTAEPLDGASRDGPGRYRVDRVVVDIAYATVPKTKDMPETRTATVRLLQPIATGTLLDRIEPSKPVLDLGGRLPWPAEELSQRLALSKPAFIFTAAPASTASGALETPFLTGTLGYSYTGRVREATTRSGAWIGREDAFMAGQPVYGVPMTGPLQPLPVLMWCAPTLAKGRWLATCVRGEDVQQQVHPKQIGGFVVQSIIVNQGFASDPVEVEAGPAAFPAPITLSYRVWRWGRKVVGVEGVASAPGGEGYKFFVDVPRDPDGTGHVAVAGGELLLRQRVDGGFEASIVRPLRAAAAALPAAYPSGATFGKPAPPAPAPAGG